MSAPLKIYGVPMSQAVRTVIWLLLNKKLPFELVVTVPGSPKANGTRDPEYMKKFPNATIPGLEETDSGFLLGESLAIMTYLCTKHGWTDLYPDDPERRSKVDSILHYHHRSFKEATLAFFAPKVRTDLGLAEPVIEMSRRVFTNGLKAMETQWLANNQYLTGDSPTVADMAAYVELGQLKKEFTNTFDYQGFSNVSRWLDDMSKLDGHDDSHLVLKELGDISQGAPEMERIMGANMKGIEIVNKKIAEM